MHRHGFYERFCTPTGAERFRVQRFLCVRCGHTVEQLWQELRRALGTAEAMLRFLARACERSLLGDYAWIEAASAGAQTIEPPHVPAAMERVPGAAGLLPSAPVAMAT